ncbi:MAG: hypothetical protein U0075_16655 [Thermomicrobiales bacterium]
MDTTSFDSLTRTLGRARSRRETVRLLAGGFTAGILASRLGTTALARDFDPCSAEGDQGLTLCGGTCVILSVNRLHCGACGVICAAEARCQDGMCVPIPDFLPAVPAPLPVVEDPMDIAG